MRTGCRDPRRSFETVGSATLEWLEWFNNRHAREPIGNIPPAEAEENGHAKLDEQKLAARLE
jgi:putative transposase